MLSLQIMISFLRVKDNRKYWYHFRSLIFLKTMLMKHGWTKKSAWGWAWAPPGCRKIYGRHVATPSQINGGDGVEVSGSEIPNPVKPSNIQPFCQVHIRASLEKFCTATCLRFWAKNTDKLFFVLAFPFYYSKTRQVSFPGHIRNWTAPSSYYGATPTCTRVPQLFHVTPFLTSLPITFLCPSIIINHWTLVGKSPLKSQHTIIN